MARKFNKVVTCSMSLLLIILLALTGARCGDEKDPEFVFMAFEIHITINPQSDQFLLGDTLWLAGSFPNTLKESHTGNYYTLSDFNFELKICVNQLVDKSKYAAEQPGDYTMFDYVIKTGESHQISTKCGTFNPVNITKSYSYKIGIIPKQSGIYNIFHLPPIDNGMGIPFNLKDFIS